MSPTTHLWHRTLHQSHPLVQSANPLGHHHCRSINTCGGGHKNRRAWRCAGLVTTMIPEWSLNKAQCLGGGTLRFPWFHTLNIQKIIKHIMRWWNLLKVEWLLNGNYVRVLSLMSLWMYPIVIKWIWKQLLQGQFCWKGNNCETLHSSRKQLSYLDCRR